MAQTCADQPHADLRARLEDRRPEIDRAILTRVYAISDPTLSADPSYLEGLRAAVAAAVDYGLELVGDGGERSSSIPVVLLAQARLAARNDVSLDVVLRRYFTGYTLLGNFLIEEAQRGGDLDADELKRLLHAEATHFDNLIASLSEEYVRASSGRRSSPEHRRAERVRRLLDGELLDTSELEYDLKANHLGLIVIGVGAMEWIRELAGVLDCRLLAVSSGEEVVWAWLGGRKPLDPGHLRPTVTHSRPEEVLITCGESGHGVAGWRLTHHQAAATVPIAMRKGHDFTRYADFALLASIIQDDVLTISLREQYLAPLEQHRDGGRAARETLRAYFAAERNAASAAAALGVSRQTVSSRLRGIEERLGRPLSACSFEMEATLRLEDLGESVFPSRLNSAPIGNSHR
jgi:hypothetical protein